VRLVCPVGSEQVGLLGVVFEDLLHIAVAEGREVMLEHCFGVHLCAQQPASTLASSAASPFVAAAFLAAAARMFCAAAPL
jgi:hypothetical protein